MSTTKTELSLAKYINTQQTKKLLESFYDVFNIPVAIIDINNTVIASYGSQELCTLYHKQNEITFNQCLQNSKVLKTISVNSKPIERKCNNGLNEILFPIFMNETHIATCYLGQFFYNDDELNTDFFNNQVINLGFDRTTYLNSLKKINRFDKSHVTKALNLFANIVEMISSQVFTTFESEIENGKIALVQKEVHKISKDHNVILDNIRALIFYKDTKNTILRVTESVATLTGLQKSDIEGKNAKEIYPETAELYYNDDLEVIKSKSPKLGIIEPLHNKEGVETWLLTDKIPLIGDDGDVYGIIVFSLDISERIENERILKENEANFRHIAEKTPTAIMIYQDNKWVYSNNAASIISGYSINELLSMNFWDFVHPDFKNMIITRGKERLNGEITIPTRYEFKIITKQGEEKWVNMSGSSSIYKNKPAGIISVIDITSRKNIELELKESEDRFRNYIEFSPTPIFITNIKGEYVYSNNAANKLIGYPDKELKQLSILDVTPPDDINSTIELMNALIQGKKIKNIETNLITKSKKVIRVSIDAAKISENRYISFCKDVTQIKKYQTDLIQAKELAEINYLKLNSLINAIPDLIFIYSKNGKYLECYAQNDTDLYDKPNTLINRNISECLPAEVANIIQLHINETIEKKQAQIFTYKLSIAKAVQTFEARMTYIDDSKVLSIVRNISESLRVFEDLKRAKLKAEENDKLKSAFLANLSHEIRTPLNGIMGFSEMLIDEVCECEVAKNYAQIIHKSGDSLLNTVEDIMNISFLQTNQLNPIKFEFSLKKLLTNVCDRYKDSSKNKDLRFICNIPQKGKDFILFSDENIIKTAIYKLLDNAFKFCSTGTVEFGFELIKNNTIRLFVKDTGVGINPKISEKLYENLIQTKSATSKTIEGLGLGLPIAYGMLRALGYELIHDANYKQGTKFYFDIV